MKNRVEASTDAVMEKYSINPQFDIVEYAKIFFISVCDTAATPPMAIVNRVMISKPLTRVISEIHIGFNFRTKNTPAATKVAECISEDAGAGASIESGNQKWNGNCADLHDAATKNDNTMAVCILGEPSLCVLKTICSVGSVNVP